MVMLCVCMLLFVPDPYKANIADVNIHVSYDRDEDSPPLESSAAPGNELQQEQQPSNDDGSIVHGEDVSKVIDSEVIDGSTKDEISAGQPAGEGVAEKEETNTEQEVNQHPVEPSEQVPIESHTGEVPSADEANMMETQEKQSSTSGGQEQNENQPTESLTTVEAENKDEP